LLTTQELPQSLLGSRQGTTSKYKEASEKHQWVAWTVTMQIPQRLGCRSHLSTGGTRLAQVRLRFCWFWLGILSDNAAPAPWLLSPEPRAPHKQGLFPNQGAITGVRRLRVVTTVRCMHLTITCVYPHLAPESHQVMF
jgi:hypothetical protein